MDLSSLLIPSCESTIELPKFASAEELYKYMHSEIKYSGFSKLMSHDEVALNKRGSCHDQVMYELVELRKLKLSPKAIFLIEHQESGTESGMTHSFVYYKENDKILWFENAWKACQGINKFDSMKDLIRYIKMMHSTGKFGNIKKFSKLQFAHFYDKDHTPGESLQKLVDICLDKCIDRF